MRFTTLPITITALLATTITAQDELNGLPACSLSCFIAAAPEANCEVLDTKCQCTTGYDKMSELVMPCVKDSCSAEDAEKVVPAVVAICAQEGVILTALPTATSTTAGIILITAAPVTRGVAESTETDSDDEFVETETETETVRVRKTGSASGSATSTKTKTATTGAAAVGTNAAVAAAVPGWNEVVVAAGIAAVVGLV